MQHLCSRSALANGPISRFAFGAFFPLEFSSHPPSIAIAFDFDLIATLKSIETPAQSSIKSNQIASPIVGSPIPASRKSRPFICFLRHTLRAQFNGTQSYPQFFKCASCSVIFRIRSGIMCRYRKLFHFDLFPSNANEKNTPRAQILEKNGFLSVRTGSDMLLHGAPFSNGAIEQWQSPVVVQISSARKYTLRQSSVAKHPSDESCRKLSAFCRE